MNPDANVVSQSQRSDSKMQYLWLEEEGDFLIDLCSVHERCDKVFLMAQAYDPSTLMQLRSYLEKKTQKPGLVLSEESKNQLFSNFSKAVEKTENADFNEQNKEIGAWIANAAGIQLEDLSKVDPSSSYKHLYKFARTPSSLEKIDSNNYFKNVVGCENSFGKWFEKMLKSGEQVTLKTWKQNLTDCQVEISGAINDSTYAPEGNNYDTGNIHLGKFRDEIGFDGISTGRWASLQNFMRSWQERNDGRFIEEGRVILPTALNKEIDLVYGARYDKTHHYYVATKHFDLLRLEAVRILNKILKLFRMRNSLSEEIFQHWIKLQVSDLVHLASNAHFFFRINYSIASIQGNYILERAGLAPIWNGMNDYITLSFDFSEFRIYFLQYLKGGAIK